VKKKIQLSVGQKPIKSKTRKILIYGSVGDWRIKPLGVCSIQEVLKNLNSFENLKVCYLLYFNKVKFYSDRQIKAKTKHKDTDH